MFSLLENCDLSPVPALSKNKPITLLRENANTTLMHLPNGAILEGRFSDGKLNGVFALQFPDSGVTVKGKAKNNMMSEGTIIFDTGLKVESMFHNNGHDDVYNTSLIKFKCGVNLRAVYDQQGRLTEAQLYGLKSEPITKFDGTPIVFYLQKNYGVIVKENSFYEGEITNNNMSGTGVEYYPTGLGYHLIDQTDKTRGVTQTRSFCFFTIENYIMDLELKDDRVVKGMKVYSNGVVQRIHDVCGEPKCTVSFEKLGYTGVIEVKGSRFMEKAKNKGVFIYNNIKLEVDYEFKEKSFYLSYDGHVFTLNQFFNKFLLNFDYNQSVSEDEAELYITVKKQFTTCKSAKDCEKLKDSFEVFKEKTLSLIEGNHKDKHSLLEAQNLINILFNQLEQKNAEIAKLKGNDNNLDQQTQAKFFSGSKVNGLNEGFCVEITSTDDYYEGEYRNGQLESQGVLRTGTFEYIGNFKNGKFSGEGTKVYLSNGKKLKGQFFEGRFLGNSLSIEKLRYIGDIRNDCMNGRGRLIFADDWEFEGVFQNDEIIKGKSAGNLINKKTGSSFPVEYNYVSEIDKNVFVNQTGTVYGYETSSGVLKGLF